MLWSWVKNALGFVQSYCAKCRAVSKIESVKRAEIRTPSGTRKVQSGVCKDCGSNTSTFIAA